MLIPDGQGPDQSVHDVTIVDMGKLAEPHVPILHLAELIHRWSPAVINHMRWRQQEIERMRSVAKTELKHNSMKPCTFCGASIKINMYRHVARCHLQLAQLWRCPVPWCTIWKGTPQDLMTHIVLGHKVPGETKRACLQKLFPTWTVTREQYAESLSPKQSGISNDVLLFSEVGLTLVHHYRMHSAGQPHAMFRGKYPAQLHLLLLTGTTTLTPERPLGNASPQVTHMSGITDDSCARLRPPSERPPGNASPQVTHMSGITDDSCARLRPPGRRRRSQRWIQNTAMHVAHRLTEQDPRMAAGAMVFDFRLAVLPVAVDVSGIDMRTVRRAQPPAEAFVAPAERKQEFRGLMWLDHIDPELEVIPLLDSETDCQDELSSPDGSPMVISPIVGLMPSQGEDDINLTQILAEFGTLPAFVTPIIDQYAEGEMPPTEYHPPEVPTDLFVMPAGPVDGVSSTRDLTVPAFPTPEGRSVFPLHTWRSPPSGEKTAKFRLQPPETAVSQSRDKANSLRERTNAPDVSHEGPFDVHRVRHHPDRARMVRAVPSVSLRTIWR